MSSTYSYSTAPTESFKLASIDSILSELPDNTSSSIDPHDIRDAVYTTWENIVFKPTLSNGIEYIGIDRSNLYEKIFLGKKQISGSNILTTNLLNSDIDLFIFNNKTDSDLSSQNTKIGFLAGASSSLFYYGGTLSIPHIEIKVISTPVPNSNVLDFNIKNSSYVVLGGTSVGGNISIQSSYGNILLNGLVFPTITQNASASNGDVLKYTNIGGNGYLVWGSATTSITTINTPGTFSINASPLIINGYNAMFTNATPTLSPLGGIAAGSTFSNVAVTQMLQMLLYPYIPPTLTLTSPTSFIEVSSISQSVGFSFSMTRYVVSSTISSITQTPTIISGGVTIITYLNSSTPSVTYYGNGSYSSSSYFSTPGVKSFTLSVVDSLGGGQTTSYAINAVYPIFYGTSNTASIVTSSINGLLSSFTKILSNNPNQTVPMSGTAVCLYYCVPAIYNISGSMSALYDMSFSPSINQKSAFRGNGTPFTMSLNTANWAGVLYNCYIYSPIGSASTTTVGYPTLYNTNYQFVF